MLTCHVKNSRKYQTLKERSGLSDFELSAQIDSFTEIVGRFPNLDELSGANSESNIKERFSLRKDNTTKTKKVLEETNAPNVEEAVKVLNNEYRDKEIEILDMGERSKFYITPRPSTSLSSIQKDYDGDNVNSMVYWSNIIEKLQNLYGIDIIPITSQELQSPEWKNIIGNELAKSFIYNGNIYINTDIATLDSPIHEFLHLLFGSLKFQNRTLYEELVSKAENFNTYKEIAELYPNRTKQDLNEEIFITELARFLTDQESALDSIPNNLKYEIFYNINRTLDSMLMGEASVNCIPKNQLYEMNLKTIAHLVNSTSMNTNYQGYFNDATLSRLLANVKSELMKSGELREECE